MVNSKRLYIDNGSMWQVGPDWYPADLIANALREAGAFNVRKCQKYDWCNQPQIVTFAVPEGVSLSALLENVRVVCKKPWTPIAPEVDWR